MLTLHITLHDTCKVNVENSFVHDSRGYNTLINYEFWIDVDKQPKNW